MFTGNRQAARSFFFDVWEKHHSDHSLEPLEEVVAGIIMQHPEYHDVFEDRDLALAGEYLPDDGRTNPFLHMGMHIAIHEQLTTNRPAGIGELYQSLLKQFADPHTVEHHMMECLGEALWAAQRNNQPPDERAYLDCLRKIKG